MAFADSTGAQVHRGYQQIIELPRTLATTDGNPNKGPKAISTKVYEKRYVNLSPPIIHSSTPTGWVPTSVILEGMFLINITPWNAHKSFADYGV